MDPTAQKELNPTEAQKQWNNFTQLTDVLYDNYIDTTAPCSTYSLGMTYQDPEYLACLSVSALIKKGYFSATRDTQIEFNPQNDKHRKVLELANHFFQTKDLKDHSSPEKLFFLDLTVQLNDIQNARKPFNFSPISEEVQPIVEITAVATSTLTGTPLPAITAEAYNPIVSIGQKIGLIANNKPISLEQLKRCAEGIDRESAVSVLKNKDLKLGTNEDVFVIKEWIFDNKDPIHINYVETKTTDTTSTTTPTSTTTNSNAQSAETPSQPQNNKVVETDPILLNLTKMQNKVTSLADKYETYVTGVDQSDIIDGVDALNAETDALKKDAKEVNDNFIKNQEMIQKAFHYANMVCESIAQDIAAQRSEALIKAQHNNLISTWEKSAAERQKELLSHHVAPSEYSLFTLHVCTPGYLNDTIHECESYAKEYRETVANLQTHIKEQKAKVKDIQDLSFKIDSNDKVYIDLMNKARKSQAKMASGFRKVATVLKIASAVLAFVPGVNLAVGATAAFMNTASTGLQFVATGAQIGQQSASKSADKYTRKIQNRVGNSNYQQQKLRNLNSNNLNDIANSEAQLINAQMKLLNGDHHLTNKAHQEELQNSIDRNTKSINEFIEAEVKLQKNVDEAKVNLENERAKVNKNEKINKMVKKYDYLGGGNKKNKAKLNEAESKKLNAETALAECNAALKNTSEERKKYEGLREATQIQLDEVKTVSAIKEHVEAIFSEEIARFDFDRDENNKLSALGVQQQAMRIGFAKYNEGRSLERELAMHSNQVLRGFFGEISSMTMSGRPTAVSDLLSQLYQMHDRYQHFDKAGSILVTFKTSIGEDGIVEALSKLNKYELVKDFLLPGMQMLTGGLAIIRLAKSLYYGPQQSEIQWLAKYTNQLFTEHRNYLEKCTIYLKEHIDKQSDELKQQIDILHNYINDVKNDIISVIKECSAETNDNLYNDQWITFKNKILEKRSQLRTEYEELLLNLEDKNRVKQKKEILTFINKLRVNYGCDKTLNGKSVAITDDVKKGVAGGTKITSGLLPYITKHPKCFTGVYASKIQLENKDRKFPEPPNGYLYQDLNATYRNLKNWINNNESLREDSDIFDRLSDLCGVLQAQDNRLTSLLDATNTVFINDAINAQNECVMLIGEKLRVQKSDNQKNIQEYTKKQLETFDEAKLKKTEITWQKYSVLERIHTTPLHFKKENLGLITLHKKRILSSFLNDSNDKISFYNKCEVKLIDKMKSPLKTFDAKGRFTEDDWLIKSSGSDHFLGMPEVTYNYDLGNFIQKFYLTSYTYKEGNTVYSKSYSSQGFFSISHIGPPCEDPSNAKSFFKFDIKYNLQNLTYAITFDPNSTVQMKHFEQIKTFNQISKSTRDNETRLLTEYYEWLFHNNKTKRDNEFNKISSEGELTPSLDGKLLPLILPKKLLEEIERVLFAETFELMAIHRVLFFPLFDFKLDKSEANYILRLHYRLIQENINIEFCSFDLASFDVAAVECFKRTYVKQLPSKSYEKIIDSTNIQEFLLQAMYAGNFAVPLPGKGTLKFENLDLYVPNPQEFEGLFNLWNTNPTTINYKTQNNTGKETNFFGFPLRPMYSTTYLSKAASLKKATESEDKIKEVFSKYEESYYLSKAMLKLRSGLGRKNMTPTEKKKLDEGYTKQLEKRGLISPANKQEAIFNLYYHGSLLSPEAKLV